MTVYSYLEIQKTKEWKEKEIDYKAIRSNLIYFGDRNF